MRAVSAFNYSSLPYTILALSSAVTNLQKTLIFQGFQGPKMQFHDFPGLESEISRFSMTCMNPVEKCKRLRKSRLFKRSLTSV